MESTEQIPTISPLYQFLKISYRFFSILQAASCSA